MKYICPECKNDIDVLKYPNIAVGHVIECNHCGITLEYRGVEGEAAILEIIEEGK